MGQVKELLLDISPLKQSPRSVFIYLPDSYNHLDKSYPVLYMFDGHNIFFDEMATYGKSWGMKNFLDNYHHELIVVGVDCNHTGNKRLDEYAPYSFESKYFKVQKPEGKITAQWYVNSLKPYIDKHFRTLKDRNNTFIAGSSMGGLMALFCIIKYNHVFSKAACLSPSILFVFDKMMALLKRSKLDKSTKVYLDFGTKELKYKNNMAHAMHALFDLNHEFQRKKVNCFPDIIQHGEHNEASWEKIVPKFLHYFFDEETVA